MEGLLTMFPLMKWQKAGYKAKYHKSQCLILIIVKH